jgi:hypothetical protein
MESFDPESIMNILATGLLFLAAISGALAQLFAVIKPSWADEAQAFGRFFQALAGNYGKAKNEKQDGFMNIKLLPILALFGLIGLSVLHGCATVPETPRQAVAASYISIELLADNIDQTADVGLISKQTENRLLDKLQQALDQINQAESILILGGDIMKAESYLDNAQTIIDSLNAYIIAEQEKQK